MSIRSWTLAVVLWFAATWLGIVFLIAFVSILGLVAKWATP